MNDLKNYVGRRLERDGEFSGGYREGYEEFKTGLILKTLRLQNGMTQGELAKKLRTNPETVSRMENHAAGASLAALMRAAGLFGKKLSVNIE
ncbi:MAG: helix-turn-helix transcriptional regulator [Spirochaetaceae bacterium]|nr:helix-turn-helix transcriptional regulator [Spirochaetaceae bacterium]